MQEQKKNNPFHWRFLTVMFFVGLIVILAFLWTNSRNRNKSKEMTFAFNSWRYSREDTKEASAALAKAGLSDYQWKEGALEVPEKEKARYETVLASSKAFPHAPSDVHQESLREMGLFESESKSRLRDLYAAARQLELTLGHFSTKIDYATVGVRARNEQSGLIRKTIITASIGVWTRDEIPMTRELITAITVAARHQLGIDDNNNISILDLRNGKSWLGTDEGLADPESAAMKENEAFWKARLQDHFQQITGLEVDLNFEPVPSAQVRECPAAVLGHPGFSTFAEDSENSTWQNASLDKTPSSGANVLVRIGIPQDFIRNQLADKNDSVALLGETNRLIDQIQREAAAFLTPLTNSLAGNHSQSDKNKKNEAKINVVILNKPIPVIASDLQNTKEAEQLVTLKKIDASGKGKTLEGKSAAPALKSPANPIHQEISADPHSTIHNSKGQDISNHSVSPLISNQSVFEEKIPKQLGTKEEINDPNKSSNGNNESTENSINDRFSNIKNLGNLLWQKYHWTITIGFFVAFSFFILVFMLKKRKIETDNEKDLLENYQPKPEIGVLRTKEKNEKERPIEKKIPTEKERQASLNRLFEQEPEDEFDETIVRIDPSGHRTPTQLRTGSSNPSKAVSFAEPAMDSKKDRDSGDFDFLNQFSPGQLARLFEKERAPFIAVALHFMIQEQRDAILAILPREKSNKIISFLSQPFKIEPTLITEVERALRDRCRKILNNSF